MKNKFAFAVVILALLVTFTRPVDSANKDMVQLQTQVQALTDQMAQMKTSFDERMGVMRNLIEQSTDNTNKVAAAVNGLAQELQKQHTDSGSRVDQVSAQIQALNDSVDEVKARMAKVSKQMDDLAAAQQNLQSAPPGGLPATQPGAPAGAQQPPQPAAPPPDVLYNNALRDYNAGKYDLAGQEFADYLKFYATTDLAGNAQFYLADMEYKAGKYEDAVRDFDKVIEQYPGGNKTATAQLRKGLALLELGNRDAGVRELRSVVARYPNSIEANQARDRLRRLGVPATAPTAAGRRR
jgi:tol-pal system protein YbgF